MSAERKLKGVEPKPAPAGSGLPEDETRLVLRSIAGPTTVRATSLASKSPAASPASMGELMLSHPAGVCAVVGHGGTAAVEVALSGISLEFPFAGEETLKMLIFVYHLVNWWFVFV